MFAAPSLLNELIMRERFLGETGAPASGSCEISQFWQKTQRKVHEVKKIVPEPFRSTKGGSSPKWRKNVATRAVLFKWQAPSLAYFTRSIRHRHSQKMHWRRIRFASWHLRSKKLNSDFAGGAEGEFPSRNSSIAFESFGRRRLCSCHNSFSVISRGSCWHDMTLQTWNFAGLRFRSTL